MHPNKEILVHEIPYCDPVSLFRRFHDQKWAMLFDSALHHSHYGRYSYIAVDPFQVLWVQDNQITLDDTLVTSHSNPFHLLNDLLAKMPQSMLKDLPPFQGGVAGTFSYELAQYLENTLQHTSKEADVPDLALGFYDVVISFDADEKKAWVISTGWPELTPEARLLRASARLNSVLTKIKENKPEDIKSAVALAEPISSNFNQRSYTDAVTKVINYIHAGDIFEANISQRFSTNLPSGMTPFELYQRLRKDNPAPFAAFINLGERSFASASPERFLQLLEGKVETRPIKGTRPRSTDPMLDKQFAQELVNSAKDYAENVMIVDLLRNDLSKVCKDHSIKVSKLCGLESYASVHHLVSVITGDLQTNHTAVDLFMAAFPSGSVTGAPKIRAMEIIAELEGSKRGMYCGSLGFIGFNGAMDTSVVIRSYSMIGDTVTFQAGGAVVSESNPEEEYQETLTKSKALRLALGSTL